MRRTYIATADHTKGKSVGHPCVDGVYSDPTDSFQLEWESTDELDCRVPIDDIGAHVEAAAWKELHRLVDESEPCKCRRHLSPGGESWFDSVAITVTCRE